MMKKTIKLIILIVVIMMMFQSNVYAFLIDPTTRARIVYDNTMPYHYEGEEKVKYKMLEYGDNVLYTLNRNNSIVMTLFTSTEGYTDYVCERILENGYPAKTYEELNLNSEFEAYFATQEAIYAYLEKRDISKYIAENEQGERILNASNKILQKARKEEFMFYEVDPKWNVSEEDEKFMYRTYNIVLEPEIQNSKIEINDNEDVKIVNENNESISELKNGDIIKFVIPRGNKPRFEVKLTYEKQGAKVYKCFDDSNTSIKYLISQVKNLQKEKEYTVPVTYLTPVTITNYDNTTKEKIEGNIFQILDKSQTIIQDKLVTDEEGIIHIFLEEGEYFLKQINVKEEYSVLQENISFKVEDTGNVELNVYNCTKVKEEIKKENVQVNVTSEDKKIVENNVTNVTNVHNTNIEKEIINKTNETNIENVNGFVNTSYLKDINNITKEKTYLNKIWKENVTNNKVQIEKDITNMERDEYITYMDFIKIGSLEVPNLPVALKQ